MEYINYDILEQEFRDCHKPVIIDAIHEFIELNRSNLITSFFQRIADCRENGEWPKECFLVSFHRRPRPSIMCSGNQITGDMSLNDFLNCALVASILPGEPEQPMTYAQFLQSLTLPEGVRIVSTAFDAYCATDKGGKDRYIALSQLDENAKSKLYTRFFTEIFAESDAKYLHNPDAFIEHFDIDTDMTLDEVVARAEAK